MVNVQNVPWAPKTIPGGSMDNKKLALQLLTRISKLNKFQKDNVCFLKEIQRGFPRSDTTNRSIFYDILYVSRSWFDKRKLVLLFSNWPVALIGGGCSVKKLAGENLEDQVGLICPTTRCTSHTVTELILRLNTSKTMCIDKMVTFALRLKPILKHFKLSGKNTALLYEALEVLEAKQIKLMTWCPTRMCNLLQCSSCMVVLLLPLCDTLVTAQLKEETDYFLSLVCPSILYLFADLNQAFVELFLHKLDTDEAYGIAEKNSSMLEVGINV